MKKDSQTIKCDVRDCRHHREKYCNLDSIKVAPCRSGGDAIDEGTKEATMCDNFEVE